MRVAIVASPYLPVPPTKYGGIELVIHYLVKGLVELGHEPVLLATGDSKTECEVIPITEKSISFPRTPKGLEDFAKIEENLKRQTRRKLRQLLRERKIDIVHSHGFDLKGIDEAPILTTIHNAITLEDLPYYQSRKDLNYVSISQNQQNACPDLNYVDVVYNGENPDKFPLVLEPDDYVCFLGRFDRDKNPHLAIELALSLGLKIKIAGKIDYRGDDYFRRLIKPHLENPLVEYLGELGFEDKVELLSHARCNLHPLNFREPFGLTVIEAAYCGTPTLALAKGSMPELIENDRTGILVEDFVEGYYQLSKCFEMDRSYIAQRARMLFNYNTMAKQYLKVYEQIIKDFRKAARRRDK